ncbi:prolipoprotein diacylglyceryl transferase [Candidatus Peregrinibacteria bacterium]|nr:prolipoprotein diacylglyceryl transferase [Candidatus Peregrinibacteria bacterium]
MIDPIAFSIGPVSVRWYGLFYGIGLGFSFFLARWMIARRKLSITQDQLMDFLFWIFLAGVIVGGRLGYILFYNLPYYLANPLKVFAVWEGGMSFHGGLIGAILVGILYCRKQKIDPWHMADLVIVPAPLALALGRLGNFINRELAGRLIADPRWNFLGMDFGDGALRFPSQLFASFKDILIFGVLFFLFFRHPKKGVLLGIFLILYGFLRFTVEFWRAPDPQVGFIFQYFTLGQILSALLLIAGLVLLKKRSAS